MKSGSGLLQNDYLALLVRLILGIVFIYASLDKIVYPAQFARIIYNYHLLPGDLINLWAVVLPWTEFFCGLFLILGVYKDGAATILTGLMAVFIVAIAINLFRGVDLECGCFSVSSKAKSGALNLIYRDLVYLALGLYLLFNRSQRFLLIRPRD